MVKARKQRYKFEEKGNYNISSSQLLLSNVVGMYGIYHGQDGLQQIYDKIHTNTKVLKKCLEMIYINVISNIFFDTLIINDLDSDKIIKDLQDKGYLVRPINKTRFSITIDETISTTDITYILNIIKRSIGNESSSGLYNKNNMFRYNETLLSVIPSYLLRNTTILEDNVCHKYKVNI